MKSWILLLFFPFFLQAQTIAEKKASFESGCFLDPSLEYDLEETNLLLKELREHQKSLYQQAYQLFQEENTFSLEQIVKEIQETKKEIEQLKNNWKKKANKKQEPYALLYAPEMSLAEFIMEFVGDEAIFIIPPEIESMHINVCSNFPLPKEGVQECLETILAQYGVGIRKLSPYLSELFLTITQSSGLDAILDDPLKLAALPPESRVCFILKEQDPKTALNFLRKFSNSQLTQVQLFAGHIFVISRVDALQELLKLFSFIQTKNTKQDFELISLAKIDPTEMATILKMAFQEDAYGDDELNLKIYPLTSFPQTLVISGSKEEIKRAKTMVEDLEKRIEDPEKNTLYWYNVKHSDPDELASVLSKIYQLLVDSEVSVEKIDATIAAAAPSNHSVATQNVNASTFSSSKKKSSANYGNFVVDAKTGTIMMVVKQELLGEIKKLLERLDVPKKMVQIEVLFFEKRMENQSNCGLNLLRIGSAIASYSSPSLLMKDGILNFFFSSGKKESSPSFDLAYQFLLAQDDVQINASPSVITMNQTQASIDIVEEMSIDRGSDDKKNSIFERAQYGINLKITPTINIEDPLNEEGKAFITLDTKINLDTTGNSNSDRPKVLRRQIQNLVRIADGETVILGGLRRKNQSEKKDIVPFLGEIPGIGKLFNMTGKNDSTTEMFIFITPKIISDPIEDNRKVTLETLKKRPGDLPEFLAALDISKEKNKRKLFAQSLNALFDKMPEEGPQIRGEYDGKE